MKKIISLILTVFLILSTISFAGCDNKNAGVPFFSSEKSNFLLIRAHEADEETLAVVDYFRRAILDTHGIAMEYKNDEIKHKEGTLEVNVGVTNRPLSANLQKELERANENHSRDFTIKFSDGIAYIVGGSTYALQSGVEFFLSHFCGYLTSTIPENFEYKYHFELENSPIRIAGEKNIEDYKIVIPKYNMSYVVGREVDGLIDDLFKATGIKLEVITDDAKESPYEIIVGETTRGNAPFCTNTDEYVIKANEKKMYVNGATDLCTAMALKELGKLFKKESNIQKDFEYIGSYSLSSKEYDSTDPLYSLSFEDDFNTLDPEIWVKYESDLNAHRHRGDPSKNYGFTSTEENVKVENGNLVMRPTFDGENYYGSEVRTRDSLWFKHGLFEISFKYNNTDGLCSAFWLLGLPDAAEVSGEFDIFESYAFPHKLRGTPIAHVADWSTRFESDIEYGNLQPTREELYDFDGPWYDKVFYELPDGDTFDDDYHTIGLEWTETSARWLMDGRVWFEVDLTANERISLAFVDYMQIILTQYSNINVFPNICKDAGANTDWDNAHFSIDYLRVYQLPGQEMMDLR